MTCIFFLHSVARFVNRLPHARKSQPLYSLCLEHDRVSWRKTNVLQMCAIADFSSQLRVAAVRYCTTPLLA